MLTLADGIVLVVAAAAQMMITSASGSSIDPKTAGATGGVGILSVLYSMLVAKPRQQVKMAVDHMMYIKVIFLGYLRELGQSDQAFSRRLMEDGQITPGELSEFSEAIERVMRDTVKRLREMLDKTDKQLQSAGKDTSNINSNKRGGGGAGGDYLYTSSRSTSLHSGSNPRGGGRGGGGAGSSVRNNNNNNNRVVPSGEEGDGEEMAMTGVVVARD